MKLSSGFTMVELIATLAILGLIAAMTTVSVGSLRVSPSHRAVDRLEAARRKAIMTGVATRVPADSSGSCMILFLPDGSALGTRCTIDSTSVTIDPLTGTPHASR